MSTIRALFTPPDASSPLSSLSAHMAAYDALCRGAPRDSVMREFFTFPGVCAAVLTHLDEQERRKLVTLNDDAFMVVIAEVYEKVKAAQYEHLVERMTPTQYIAHTRHLDVRGGPALRLLPGCTDIYDYFVHFPKLERLETDDRTIVRRFVSIPSQCLEYWPRRASHYGISHTLHIRLCDIWDLGDHEAIPLEWQANSHLPLADTEFATYKLQQHLEIEFSWSEPVPDTTERRALWRDRLISILRGRCITSITIKGAQPFMLDRISAILADVQADDATHLSLESVIVKLEKWLPFNELISRHAIQAFATCAPELKIVMQGRPDDGVKGYENILTMLPFAGWITHLAFEHPFHLFGSPSMTYVVNGVNPADTDFPIDDVQWPELGNNTTRKQLSALSTIKTISFCARARGQMYYDRLDKAKAKQAAKEAARVAAEEEEAERARQAELVARELEHGPYVDPWPTSDFIDVFTCTTAVAATVQTQQTAGKSDCRSRASSCASTAGPSKGSSSSSSSSFTSASSPLNKIATALETPDEEAAREAKEKEEAELRNVSWNTRMLSCLIAVLGHKEVKLAVESIIPDEKDVSAEIIVPEHPLEDWFVDSAGEKAP